MTLRQTYPAITIKIGRLVGKVGGIIFLVKIKTMCTLRYQIKTTSVKFSTVLRSLDTFKAKEKLP